MNEAATHAETIAKRILHVPTLDTRGRDRLDFHDLSVWQLKEALVAAFEAGKSVAAPEVGLPCPYCGEGRCDNLHWTDDDTVVCSICDTTYAPNEKGAYSWEMWELKHK